MRATACSATLCLRARAHATTRRLLTNGYVVQTAFVRTVDAERYKPSVADDLGGTQSTLATSLGQQQTEMATLQTRIATLEESAKSSSDEAKSDHDRVSAVVTEMQSKLSTLLDLKVGPIHPIARGTYLACERAMYARCTWPLQILLHAAAS